MASYETCRWQYDVNRGAVTTTSLKDKDKDNGMLFVCEISHTKKSMLMKQELAF